MSEHRYAALFETGKKGGNYFRFAHLEMDNDLIPPPIVNIHGYEFVYAPDQSYLAKAFQTSQQNISRWLKNPIIKQNIITPEQAGKEL